MNPSNLLNWRRFCLSALDSTYVDPDDTFVVGVEDHVQLVSTVGSLRDVDGVLMNVCVVLDRDYVLLLLLCFPLRTCLLSLQKNPVTHFES